MKRVGSWLVLAMAAGLVQFASGSTNTFKAVTSGGQGGTDWLKYTDAANWDDAELGSAQDDALGFGNAILNNCAAAGNGRYIELPDSLSVHRMACTTGSLDTYPVLRGDGTLKYTFTSTTASVTTLGGLWLYSPYSLTGTSGYAGFISPALVICGPLVGTSFSGTANNTAETGWSYGPRICTQVIFNYSKYATEPIGADGVRTISDWTCDYQLDNGGTFSFVAPCGTAADVTRKFDLTDNSPFAKPSAGEPTDGNLPVGTAVTGAGVADGTYLKRIFPDGSIELSKPVSGSSSADLTFAAVTYRVLVDGSNSRLRPQNQGGSSRKIKVNKFRAEDDFEVRVKQLAHRIVDNNSSMKLTFTTDEGFLPGRFRIIDDWWRHSSESKTSTFSITLENCNIVPPAQMRGDDAILKLPGANHTARITVDTEEVRPAAGEYKTCMAEVKGTLVKDGVGTWNVAFTGTSTDYTGSVVIEEGTLLVANAGATLGTVEVKSGATFDVSAGGITVGNLIVADGAVVFGGRVTVGAITGDVGKIVLRNGAAVVDAASPAEPLDVELQSGTMRRLYEDGDCVAIVTASSTLRFSGSGTADILVVGGGGGAGGLTGGGGGGGGGVLYVKDVPLSGGYYGVTVGQGGKGAISRGVKKDDAGNYTNGVFNGENSAFNGLVAIGGGAGGGYSGDNKALHPDSTVKSEYGVAGGSGGGGGVLYPENGSNRDRPGGAGTEGQGYAGAKSCNRRHSNPTIVAGGGGGGAGAAAIDAYLDEDGNLHGSNGGDGLFVPIWGERYWGGGGAGSACSSVDVECKGGKGGGGDSHVGRTNNLSGGDGEPNTGGGGGAAMSKDWDSDGGQRGGNGGSGIVIIRFKSAQVKPVVHEDVIATGGTIRRRGGYAIHDFSADGTFTLAEGALVDVLVVGGGGGGGLSGGGGGAGGGVQVVSNLWVEAGTYAVTVGAGGLGQTSSDAAGYPTVGTASHVNFGQFSDLSAPGGGVGGFRKWLKPNNVGGAGGGGGAPYGATHEDASCWDPFIAGAKGVEPFGFAGGASTNWIDTAVEGWKNFKRFAAAGGGGGGAAGPGCNAWYEGLPSSTNRAQGGAGGAGVWCDFSGQMIEYGAGGAGGSAAVDGDDRNTFPGADGQSGTGTGGGGSTQCVDTYKRGGNGGCGRVIIRYCVRPRGLSIIVR